jgi:agmatine/peptidylarginine deiminase
MANIKKLSPDKHSRLQWPLLSDIQATCKQGKPVIVEGGAIDSNGRGTY